MVAALVAELRKLQGVDLLTTAEAAELARVEPKTIRRWVEAGKLSRHSAGNELRIVRTELLALLGCASVARPTAQNQALTEEEIETKVTAMLRVMR